MTELLRRALLDRVDLLVHARTGLLGKPGLLLHHRLLGLLNLVGLLGCIVRCASHATNCDVTHLSSITVMHLVDRLPGELVPQLRPLRLLLLHLLDPRHHWRGWEHEPGTRLLRVCLQI